MRKYCEKAICPELAGSYLPAVADKHPVHPVVNQFKLKKNTRVAYATFLERPSWDELALHIKESFGIDQEHAEVAYTDDDRDVVHIANQEALQRFYDFLPYSSEVIEFVVQDKTMPSDNKVIDDAWSYNSNLSDVSKGDDKFMLFCWIMDRSNNPLPVNIAGNETVGDLKQTIKNCFPELHYLSSQSLTLFKVNELIPLKPDYSLAERIYGRKDELSAFATGLESSEKLSDAFQSGPPEGHLHIIATCPPSIVLKIWMILKQMLNWALFPSLINLWFVQQIANLYRSLNSYGSLPSHIPLRRPKILNRRSIRTSIAGDINTYAQRLQTVSAIYDKLCRYKYVQVRGTPASGKTTLANLLQHYIVMQEPDSLVAIVPAWITQDQLKQEGGWRKWLADGWNEEPGSVLIVDEAHTSFRDIWFWTHIKSINANCRHRIITFSSYGNTETENSVPSPYSPYLSQVVGLHKIDHGDGVEAGLLLTEAEFLDLVEKRFIGHCFDNQFLLGIYELTNGHVGACEDVLDVIQTDNSYRRLKGTRDLYTPDLFTENIDVANLFRALSGKSIFSRGLPKPQYLQQPAVAKILLEVLRCGKKSIDDSLPFSGDVIDPEFEICIQRGWLYSKPSGPMCATHDYIFASPLHHRFVEWMLLGDLEGERKLKEENLTKFALAVIRKISPPNLIEPRQVGFSVQSVPGAQLQDEVYRACLTHTKNCVVSFPEFGTKRGRIDFFIPSKKWGIELLRNGDRLSSHMKRLTEGEYGEWTRTGVMDDYIVLDFRLENLPRANHREMNNLYYVVFQKDYKAVQVYNNEQELMDEFVPTYDVLC